MAYGTIKIDTITFTDGGIDKSVAISGLVQNPTFTGNVTVTGTISGNTVRGQTISGVTITGTTAQFTSGTFTSLTGVTVTGTTANFTSGNFTNISGGTHTITSGVFASGTAANPSISFVSDPNTGIYSPGADQLAISTNGTGRLFVDASGRVGIGTSIGTWTPGATLDVRSGFNNTTVEEIAAFARPDAAVRASINKGVVSGNGISFGTTTTHPLALRTNALERIVIGATGTTTLTSDASTAPFIANISTSEAARIDSSGRLGLGTSSPAALLDVNGTSGTYPTQQIKHSAINTDGEFLRIARTDTSNVRYHSIHARNSSSTTLIGENYIQFKIHDPNISTTGQNTVLHLDGLNRVGINDNAPGSTLTVKAATGVTPLQISGPSSEFARIDSSGRLLVGTSTGAATGGTAIPTIQLAGTSSVPRIGAFGLNATPWFVLARTTSTLIGTYSALGANNQIGRLIFAGDDGTDYQTIGAEIAAEAESAWTTDDAPTRLVFSTTADTTNSPTEALRITNDRVIAYNQAAPAAVNATATLTVANLKTGIITSTSAAATDMTLPTGTDTEAGFSGIYTNMTFEWSVINTGPSLVRVLAGTAHTIVGSGSVATGTSGRFASRRTAVNTFVTYRLS